MWNSVRSQVAGYIKAHHLLSADRMHLVALSGGPDSVALMLVMKSLNYRIEAVHCNFHLRGDESDRDEQFVKELCVREQVPLHLIHFDTIEYATLHHVSIEMAARELRYRYFAQLTEDIDAETVCVAHHRDDAVETLLMNLMRGAGIHGLTGIRPRNGHIARPLLCLSHNDILQALEAIGQTYVIDSTNLETDVLRNKIRLQLIPLLEQMTPSVSRNIARTSLYISEAEKVYDAYFRNLGLHDADRIPVSSLLESPSPLCMLHEWLAPLGFNRTQISEILDAAFSQQSGREFSSSSHILVLDRQSLIVAPDEPPVKPVVIPESGFYRIGESVSLRVSLLDTPSEISRDPSVCTVDASKVRFPLTLRTMHTGDRFVPFGMKGSKLLSDFLTDRKLSLLDKRRQLVLSDANGLIFWVLGIRVADPCRITTSTTSILKIEMQK